MLFPLLLLVAACESVLSAPQNQAVLTSDAVKPKQLHGRFLQITDMHPDPHYTFKSSEEKACHRGKPKKKSRRAGRYGTSFSECDSPLRLTNFTLDYLGKNWASEIDFVVWTGDNARHDNDRQIPRTTAEIFDLNRAVAKKMESVFKGVPVIPTLGNNDVWPHNIMTPGPNSITMEFSSIWKPFIPFPDLQVFHRGAYYSTEVIPDVLAVVSLNTMYFYDSNKAVGGCPYRQPEDPGNLQLNWLEVQLTEYRNRHMQVWLTGHVPPSRGNYFPECYVRYAEMALRFQDTILGHLFGHMNADHFFFMESIDLLIHLPASTSRSPATWEEGDLAEHLLEDFAALPKRKKEDLDNYAVVNVSPPIVPNPYTPTYRIFAYNVTGIKTLRDAQDETDKKKKKKKGGKRRPGHQRGNHGNKASDCKKEPYRDSWKCHINETWHSDPDSPSRKNQMLTPLGYAQYYIPDLRHANKTHPPTFKLEYTTFHPDTLHPNSSDFAPIPSHRLPKELRHPTDKKSKYLPYKMPDLTIESWLKLAHQLAKPEKQKLRKRFRKYMYLGS